MRGRQCAAHRAYAKCGKLAALQAHAFSAQVARGSVAEPQRGFVAGRRIEDSTLGFDGACAEASLLPDYAAAVLLLDFAQAFPSLAHRWMFRVLEHMALPEHFVSTVYKDNATVFEVSGSPAAKVAIGSGIR